MGKLCSDTVNGIQPFHENSVFIEYRNPSGQDGERFLIEYSFVDDTFSTPLSPSTTLFPVGGNNGKKMIGHSNTIFKKSIIFILFAIRALQTKLV